MTAKALRIHHRDRLKRKRRFYWGRDLSREPEALSKIVDTPKPCSCPMCGNIRRYEGDTRQERRITFDY